MTKVAPSPRRKQRIRADIAKRCVCPITVVDRGSFTAQFNMTLDPNEQGREDYSILFGILPREHIEGFSAFDADNGLPLHGFFADALFNLLGHDGTEQVLDVRR